MQFELKESGTGDQQNFYLNVKVTDSISKTKLLGIWTMDPRVREMFGVLQKEVRGE